MKRTSLVLISGVALMSFLYLAPTQANAAAVRTSKGNCSLLFQFSGLSDLGVSSYKGGIGIRHYINDGVAIRPMVRIGVGSQKDKAVTEGGEDDKDTSTEFGAELTLEKHMAGAGSVSPYVGGQAGFNYAKTKMHDGTTFETSQTMTDFGVGVVAGFEWGFSEGVTLGGEYTLGASFGSGNTKNADGDKTSDGSRTSFGNGSASLFFSVFWQ